MTASMLRSEGSIVCRKNRLTNIIKVSIYSLLIAWMINLFDWHCRGFEATERKINTNYTTQIIDLSHRSLKNSAYAVSLINWFSSLASRQMVINFFMSSTSNVVDGLHINKKKLSTSISQLAILSWLTLKAHIVKLLAIWSSWFLFLLAYMLGSMDGLVLRYKKTAEAGRDSTSMLDALHHKLLSLPVFLLSAYLLLPVSVSPVLVIAGITVMIFIFSQVTSSNLKKFL